MDCLTLFMGFIVLASSALAVLGLSWGQPSVGYVFGFFAVAGGIPFLWLMLIPTIRKRWGEGGKGVFNRVTSVIALTIVVVPLLYVLVAVARAIGPDPRFVAVSLFFLTIVGGTVFLIWWSKFILRKSWQQAAEQLKLAFDSRGPRISGDYHGRPVQLYLRSVSGPISASGVARSMHYTHLTMSLSASTNARLIVRKRNWLGKLLGKPPSQSFGDEALDRSLTCKGDAGSWAAILQTRPVLRLHLRRLLEFPLHELRIAPDAITYVCRNALTGTQRVLGVFEVTGHIADALEMKAERQRDRFRLGLKPNRVDAGTIAESLRRIQREGGGDNFVIFSLDEEKGYYIQAAARSGEPLLWAEAVSNKFLKSEFALDARRMARLQSLGWHAPEEPSKFRNFHREWAADSDEDRLRVAREMVQVMVEVYGWEPNQLVGVELVFQDGM